MQLTRRRFLGGAAAALLVPPRVASASDGGRARLEEQTFVVPGLDPAHDGLRVVQLSDLHCGDRTPPERLRDAIARANALAPDLVVLTGDYLCRERSGVALMRDQLGGLAPPTVAVLGNHDHWVDARGATRVLRSLGYAVLRNQSTTLVLRRTPFTVIGVDDLLTGNARPAEALAGAAPGSRLVLAHGPRTAEALRELGQPLLCLSGHTHGGQVHIGGLTPFLLRAVSHEPYERGRFQLGPVQLYVNRGLGNAWLRLRVNADPEISLVTLRAPAPA